LCVSSGTSCGSPSTITLSNMPAGNYVLTTAPQINGSVPNFVEVTYQGSPLTDNGTKEFFFEGFEENTQATLGTAHTGNYYFNGNYAVTFSIPNSRSYVIQWWNLVNGTWAFNEKPYTGPTTLTGPVDDVRIFPSDAQMTSYTYQCQEGITSQTDPSGRTTSYQYDGLGRPAAVLDLNGNITRTFAYSYVGAPVFTPVITSLTYLATGTRGVNVNFLPMQGCETANATWVDTNTGQTGGNAGACTSPIALDLPTAFHTYNITVTCYPGTLVSNTVSIYMPF
jgi:YD repeat-containing protein